MSDRWQLIDRDTGAVVVEAREVADPFWSRFKGLQFRAGLAAGAGLLLVPCSSIHTFWMRFAIDVVFLDDQGVVLGWRSGVRPWRVVAPVRGAHAILEVPAGSTTLRLSKVVNHNFPSGDFPACGLT